MAGGKETPRQKMIGMMYLVLTALLALNVSKEILEAFVLVNEGLENTTVSFQDKIDVQYNSFQASYEENPAKVGPYWNKALKIQQMSNDIDAYLSVVKARVMAGTEEGDPAKYEELNYLGKDARGRDTVISLALMNSKDNYDATTHLLIGGEANSPIDGEYSALEIQGKLEAYRELLKETVEGSPDLQARFDQVFDFQVTKAKTGETQSWVVKNFFHQTLAATVTLLSKCQADVKTTESDAVSYLLQSVDAASFKFNKLMAVVNTRSNLIALGDSFKADVFLAAYDSTKFPTILYGENEENLKNEIKVVDGVGRFGIRPSGVGEKSWKGVIKYETSTGVLDFPFEMNYKVSDADAVIDPSAMNVVYRGIPNPISVSVPGADSDGLRVSCSIGGVKLVPKGKGKYEITVPAGVKARELSLSVSAPTPSGGMKNVGTKVFRLKSIPIAEPEFAGKFPSDNVISRGQLKAADKLRAFLKNFVFDGLSAEVVSFNLSYSSGGLVKDITSNSNRITSEMKGVIGSMRPGQVISFTNIRVKGADGVVNKASSLTFKIA